MDLDLAVLPPHLTDVELEQVEVLEGLLVIHAAPEAARVNCPHCAVTTRNVHDQYVRQLADVALGAGRC